MSRIFNQKNMWGSQGGPNPQRSDFWQVDFSQVVRGINAQIAEGEIDTDLEFLASDVEPYYISSVSMPAMKVKADEFKRDSRPYMMPGFDEALSEIKINFVMESPVNAKTSKVYQFLEAWRAFVRSGRGAMGNEKTVSLDKNFTAKFRYPVTIILMRGNAAPKVHQISETLSGLNNEYYGDLNALTAELEPLSDSDKSARLSQILANAGVFSKVEFQTIENDLENCAVFQVENMWLSGYKLTDLDYSKGNEIMKIEASFYADNIRDLNQL